jgi:hypothetical protein
LQSEPLVLIFYYTNWSWIEPVLVHCRASSSDKRNYSMLSLNEPKNFTVKPT